MMGGRGASQYVKNWRFSGAVPLFRQIPSLTSLDVAFWTYLAGLRISGSMKAVPDGTRFEDPIEPSDELKKLEGEGAFDVPLIELTDRASAVALVSPAITAILDSQIAYGAMLFNYKLSGDPTTFWFAERTGHPLWGRLAAEVEAVFESDIVTQLQRRIVYIAWDPAKPPPKIVRNPSGEWRHDYDDRVPLGPNAISTRALSNKLDVNVRLLITAPRNVEMKLLVQT